MLLTFAERLGRRALRARGVQSRNVAVPGGALHLYDGAGAGPLPQVALLHGIGSAATPFGPVLQRLRRHHQRVLALDAPGHGFSPPPPGLLTTRRLFEGLQAALDQELTAPALVVGNSLGGAMALRYALERPERVAGLVLVSPAGARAGREATRALLSSFAMPGDAEARAFLGRLYHDAPWFMPYLAPTVRQLFQRAQIRDLLHSINLDEAFSPEDLARLGVPTLFLWGRSERLLPDDHLRYFREHLPRARAPVQIDEPEDFGHCPHLDRPGPLAARITAFARSLQPREL